jgi:hypothetical protein
MFQEIVFEILYFVLGFSLFSLREVFSLINYFRAYHVRFSVEKIVYALPIFHGCTNAMGPTPTSNS